MVISHDSNLSNNKPQFVTIYKRIGDTFTKLNDPDITITSGIRARRVSFSPDGLYFATALSQPPFVNIFQRSGDVFTKSLSPNIPTPGQAFDVDYSLTGGYLAVSHDGSPFMTIYKEGLDQVIIKGNNMIDENADHLGYALEDGIEGETKTMMSLFTKEE